MLDRTRIGIRRLMVMMVAALLLTLPLGFSSGALAQPGPEPQPQSQPEDAEKERILHETLVARAKSHLAAGRSHQALVTLSRIVITWDKQPEKALWAREQLAGLFLEELRMHPTEDARDAFLENWQAVMNADDTAPGPNRLMARFLLFMLTVIDAEPAERRRVLEDAARYAKVAADALPADVDAQLLLAGCLARLNKTEEAANVCATVLKLDADNDEARYLMFQQLLKFQKTVDGHNVYSLAEELLKRNGIQARRRSAAFDGAKYAVAKGDGEGAVELMDLAVANVADSTLRLARRVVHRYDQNELNGAQTSAAREELSGDPIGWSEARRKRLLALVEGDGGAALTELQALLALMQAREYGREAGERSWNSLQKFNATEPLTLEAWPALVELRAALALELDHAEVALKDYTDLAAHNDRTDLSLKAAALKEAVDAGYPAPAVRWFFNAYDHPQYETSKQVAAVEKSLELAPDWARPHLLRADLANREQDYEVALQHYQAAAKSLPDSEDVLSGLAFAHFLLPGDDHAREATTRFRALAAAHPGDAHYRRFAELLSEVEGGIVTREAWMEYYRAVMTTDPAQQITHLESAHRLQPTLHEPLVALGQAQLNTAIEEMRLMTALSGDEQADARKRMQAAFESALSFFARALANARTAGQKADAMTWRARVYFLRYRNITVRDEEMARREDLKLARDLLAQALELEPGLVPAALLLGQIEELLDNLPGTHAAFANILARVPEAQLFQFDGWDPDPPQLEFPDGVGRFTEHAADEPTVALTPRFGDDGQRYAYRVRATLSDFLAPDGRVMQPSVVEFRIDVTVLKRLADGMADVALEVVRVDSDNYAALLDRRFTLRLSSLLGAVKWTDPVAPGLPADPAGREEALQKWELRCAQFRSLIGPAIVEAWAFAPGRTAMHAGDVWQKEEAGGLIHLYAPAGVASREASFIASLAGDRASIVRLARIGGGPDGDLGHLRTELTYDSAAARTTAVTVRLMNLVSDTGWNPGGNTRDMAESNVLLELELLRAD